MARSLIVALLYCMSCLPTQAFADDPAQAEQRPVTLAHAAANRRALALAEFCGRAAVEGPSDMPAMIGKFPGMALSEPLPLWKSQLPAIESIAKAFGISEDAPVRIASFSNTDVWDARAVIRGDAEACDIAVEGTEDAPAVFVEHLGRTDSDWTRVNVAIESQQAWKRPGRDGSFVVLVVHPLRNFTAIRMFTWRAGNPEEAETFRTTAVFVDKCVAAIRAWQPANPADFLPAFTLEGDSKGSTTVLRATSGLTGLALALRFGKEKGPDCVATTRAPRVPVGMIFGAMADAFMQLLGAYVVETASGTAGGNLDMTWRVTVAEGRTAVMSGTTKGETLVMTIHPGVPQESDPTAPPSPPVR